MNQFKSFIKRITRYISNMEQVTDNYKKANIPKRNGYSKTAHHNLKKNLRTTKDAALEISVEFLFDKNITKEQAEAKFFVLSLLHHRSILAYIAFLESKIQIAKEEKETINK